MNELSLTVTEKIIDRLTRETALKMRLWRRAGENCDATIIPSDIPCYDGIRITVGVTAGQATLTYTPHYAMGGSDVSISRTILATQNFHMYAKMVELYTMTRGQTNESPLMLTLQSADRFAQGQ